MKIKRYKQVRKYCAYYKLNFKFRAPYRIVLDKELLQAAVIGKVLLRDQIPKLMQAETKIFITRCILEDLRKGGREYKGASQIGSSLPFLKCRHGKGFRESKICVWHLLAHGNPDFLMVGAQDVELRRMVRGLPGVPTLYINGSVPIMEPPSRDTKTQQSAVLKAHSSVSASEQKVLDVITPSNEPRFKKKKIKGPNPLSVKKKKRVNEDVATVPAKRVKTQDAQANAPATQSTGTVQAIVPKKKRVRNRSKAARTGKAAASDSKVAPVGVSIDT